MNCAFKLYVLSALSCDPACNFWEVAYSIVAIFSNYLQFSAFFAETEQWVSGFANLEPSTVRISLTSMNDSRLSTLDQLDFSIMNHLRDDGRKSFTELGEMLGVSPSTIRNRYAKLVEENVLQVYGRIHPEHVGNIAYAHILIDVRPSERVGAVVAEIADYPEVCFLALATGEYDLVVDVMCRNNDHLLELTNERLNRLAGVYKTKAQMYTRLIKIAQPDLSGYFLSADSHP